MLINNTGDPAVILRTGNRSARQACYELSGYSPVPKAGEYVPCL